MSVWQSDYIQVGEIRLHYTRTGGDKPPVVLAHGFSDDGLCWTPVAEVLAPAYDVIMVDARGHGRSTGPEQGYGSVEYAGDLAGLISGLGLGRPTVLGHSMGAVTALALAGLYPELPRAILLEDPPAWWTRGPSDSPAAIAGRARMDARIIGLKRKTREELIADQHREAPAWSEAELAPWAEAKQRFSLYVLNRSGVAPVDWPETLRRITCPTLLITADPERGGIVTPDDAAVFQTLVSQAQVAHIPGAGHNIRREQFARYLEVVGGFLAEVHGS